MRLGELAHAGEAEIIGRHVARMHRGAETLVGMAAVDPAGLQPDRVGRLVVMEHAFGGVQDHVLPDPALGKPRQHVFEIAQARLVGADVLRRVDRVEVDAELPVAEAEILVVDVRQDHQLVVLLEIGQRARRVGKRRPVAHALAIAHAVVPARRDLPLLGEALVHHRQQLTIQLPGRLQLLHRFMPRMRFQDGVATERRFRPVGQRFQRFDHAGLPVDQGAVAIEGQHLEVGQPHACLPFFACPPCATRLWTATGASGKLARVQPEATLWKSAHSAAPACRSRCLPSAAARSAG